MIFKVSPKITGSIILKTLNIPLRANAVVSISGDDLVAEDVKNAISRKFLIPIDQKKYKLDSLENARIIVENNTNQTLVLGAISIKPLGKIAVDRSTFQTDHFINALSKKYIKILSSTDSTEKLKKEIEAQLPESETKPVVWDMREQKLKEAELVPKSKDIVEAEPEKEEKVENKAKTKKKVAKKKSKKKTTKKKTKKKGIAKKKKKVKPLEPVGEVKDAVNEVMATEMDSRGNVVTEKPSNVLQELIEEVENSEISFVDNEQSLERLQNRPELKK